MSVAIIALACCIDQKTLPLAPLGLLVLLLALRAVIVRRP